MPRLVNHNSAEDFLFDEGLLARRSVQREATIGCIGCRWLNAEQAGEEVKVYGYELIKCTRLKGGTLYPLLRSLEETGAIISEFENINPEFEGRPARKYFYPADTAIGEGFFQRLELPVKCDLDQED